MTIEGSSEFGAGYLHLKPEVQDQFGVSVRQKFVDDERLIIDIDENDEIIGIESLSGPVVITDLIEVIKAARFPSVGA